MKKYIISLIAILFPLTTYAALGVGWQATSTSGLAFPINFNAYAPIAVPYIHATSTSYLTQNQFGQSMLIGKSDPYFGSSGGAVHLTIDNLAAGCDALNVGNMFTGFVEFGIGCVGDEIGVINANDNFIAVQSSWPTGDYWYGDKTMAITYGSGNNAGDGNVGIGTLSPSSKLTVNGSSGIIESVTDTSNSNIALQTTSGNYFTSFSNSDDPGSESRNAGYLSNGTSHVVLADEYNNSYFTNQNVGIGTNNPQFKLEVTGNASTTNLYLPHTNSSSKGIIYKDYPAFGALNPTAFLHDYAPSTADGYNIFLGVSSGNFTLSPGGGASSKASNDIGIGNSTLSTLTTGYQNIGIGSSALTANTTGFDNTAIGHQSTLSNTTGKENTGYGANTLTNNTTGNYNTGIGGSALNGNATGSANVAIGYQAGTNFGYYASSTYLGYNADSSVGSLTNSMGLGYDSKTTKSNQVVIGSTTVTETLLNGKVGVGMTPAQAIDINGIVQANSFIATSTTATSTFPNASTTNFVANKIINYNAENTASVGVPYIVAYGRVVGTTTAVSNVFQNSAGAYSTYTVGSSDASYDVHANLLITTATSHSFTTTVAYTDEGGTARTKTIAFSNITGASVTNIANTLGAVPYPGIVFQIRAKAGTTISVATTGTFTTVTYNVESSLWRIN